MNFNFTADDVKQLRAQTGNSMTHCKHVLQRKEILDKLPRVEGWRELVPILEFVVDNYSRRDKTWD